MKHNIEVKGMSTIKVRMIGENEWEDVGILKQEDDSLKSRVEEIFQEAEELWQWMNK